LTIMYDTIVYIYIHTYIYIYIYTHTHTHIDLLPFNTLKKLNIE